MHIYLPFTYTYVHLFIYTGANPRDIAQSWADPRVLVCVQDKFDKMPPMGGGKGKGKGKGGKATPAKRPQSVPAGDAASAPPGTAKVGVH